MSVRLYMDHNVHAAITAGLRRRGIDVITAEDDGRQQVSDSKLLTRADQLQRLLFTHDDDLLAEAHRRQLAHEHFAGVSYVHQLKASIGQCVSDLEIICGVYDLEDVKNRVIHLPL